MKRSPFADDPSPADIPVALPVDDEEAISITRISDLSSLSEGPNGPQDAAPSRRALSAETARDALGLYLEGMGRIPLLSREDELLLGNRIHIARKRFQSRIFESPLALVEVARLLEEVRLGKGALHRVVRVPTDPGEAFEAQAVSRSTLGRTIRTLREMVDSFRNTFRLTRARPAERTALRAQETVRGLRKAQVRFLQGMHLQPAAVESVIGVLEGRLRTLVALEAASAGPGKAIAESVPGDLEAAVLDAGETAQELDRRMEEVSTLRREFDREKRTLAAANLRLVVSIARGFADRGLPLLDLIQEGNLGLLHAVEKYEPHRGFRFSTYATWWIRQAVQRGLADSGRSIRLPVNVLADRARFRTEVRRLTQEFGRSPTVEEIAKKSKTSRATVSRTLGAARISASLDTPVGSTEDSTLGSLLRDKREFDPVEGAQGSLLRERLGSILNTLTARERDIVRLRFGLDNGQPYTLEEIGRLFQVSRERIRQIENLALRKLRHPLRARLLSGFLPEGTPEAVPPESGLPDSAA
jgi:RNA polymerase primary sigma factor